MGREVRRVPPNWKHPKNYLGNFIPLRDGREYDSYAKEWDENYKLWINGNYPGQTEFDCKYYFEAEPPPIKDDYTDVKQEECTWYQYYECTSEGTPLSPPFETKQQLIDYLSTEKHFDGEGPWAREIAEKIVY